MSGIRDAPTRLTAEDLLYLRLERRDQPCHFSALLVLGDAARLDLASVREVIDRRSASVVKLRRRVQRSPRLGGRPVWVDDPAFDIRRHVRAASVPAPGDEAALLVAATREHERRLGRAHPLWEVVLLTGMSDGRVGVLLKLHHCVADGIAALTVLAALLDEEPSTRPNLASKAPGRHGSPSGELARAFFGGRAERVTSLNAPVGPARIVRALDVDLRRLRGAAHAEDATVNDVVLTLWAGGLRALLLARGERIADVICSVPVSLRQGGADAVVDNQTGTMLVPLPAGEADPWARLRAIARRTRTVKGRQQPALIMTVLAAFVGTRFGRNYLAHQRAINVLATNLRGPAEPVRLLGAPVLRVLPMLDLVGNLGLALAAFSYAGRMELIVTADAAAFPDLDVLMAGMAGEWVRFDGSGQGPINAR